MGRLKIVSTGSGGGGFMRPTSPMDVWAPVSPMQGYTAMY